MFENKYIERLDCHYSRIIASWYNAGGEIPTARWAKTSFAKWLKSLGFTDQEAYDIWNMATCGKLELEHSAEKFINLTGPY